MKDLKTVKLSRSVRKSIREQKALIRRGSSDKAVCAKLISDMYAAFGVKMR